MATAAPRSTAASPCRRPAGRRQPSLRRRPCLGTGSCWRSAARSTSSSSSARRTSCSGSRRIVGEPLERLYVDLAGDGVVDAAGPMSGPLGDQRLERSSLSTSRRASRRARCPRGRRGPGRAPPGRAARRPWSFTGSWMRRGSTACSMTARTSSSGMRCRPSPRPWRPRRRAAWRGRARVPTRRPAGPARRRAPARGRSPRA